MAAITPIKYAETSTGGVRNPMKDFVSNLPNIYNQYLTILDRNRQRDLQDAQFAESKRQFDESLAIEGDKLKALEQANIDRRQYQQDILDYTTGEPARRINEKLIDFYLNSFSNPYGAMRGSGSSDGSGGYKRDAGLDTHIQKGIDYYYSLAKDIDSLSSYIAKLKNTSSDEEFNRWFAEMPKEEQEDFLRISALSGKKLGEKIDYAKLADSLSEQLDNRHSRAQSVYENMTRYIDNTNKALGGQVYNIPVNLFPERHPDAIKRRREEELAEQEKINAKKLKERIELEALRRQIEETAFGSNYDLSGTSSGKFGTPVSGSSSGKFGTPVSGSSSGKFGTPVKAENRVETDATKIADYLQGLQRTVYDANVLRNRGTNPIRLGIGSPDDPYFDNNVYEMYLKTLNTGKNR